MFSDQLTQIKDDSLLLMHKSSPEFIEKLYQMLEDPHTDKYIRWAASGLSFLILSPPEFARKVLENHFKHGNLSSFVRQLNKYDFHKIKSTEQILEQFGSQVWEFKNDYFQKNRRDLMLKIKRKRSTSERSLRGSFDGSGFGSDSNSAFQNQAINTLKVITRYFQVIIEDINELKAVILQGKSGRNAPEKVLVCDSDVSSSSFAAQILSRVGLSIIVAENEDEAGIRIETEKFDVYILSGLLRNCTLITRKIKQINPEAQIVVFVDSSFKHESYMFLNMGANEILIKPYLEETLIHVINNCLENKKRSKMHWNHYNTE